MSTADNFCKVLDPDQALQNVWPDLDPNCFDTLIKNFLKKLTVKKAKLPSRQRGKGIIDLLKIGIFI